MNQEKVISLCLRGWELYWSYRQLLIDDMMAFWPDITGQLVRCGEPSLALHLPSVWQLHGDGLAVLGFLCQQGVALLLQLLVEAEALWDESGPRVQLERREREGKKKTIKVKKLCERKWGSDLLLVTNWDVINVSVLVRWVNRITSVILTSFEPPPPPPPPPLSCFFSFLLFLSTGLATEVTTCPRTERRVYL